MFGYNPAGGTPKIYRYEDFKGGTPQFHLLSEINPDPQIAVIPQNYRGAAGNSLADVTTFSGYPSISWSNDVFNIWLAQNGQKINLTATNLRENYGYNQAQNLLGMTNNIGSALKGNLGEAITGETSDTLKYYQNQTNYDYQIKMQMAEIEYQQKLPDTANFGGNNATLIGYGLFDKNIFSRYTIKAQFAKRIDKFFTMYGYQTNELKVPNLNNRPNWNYVKLNGANIVANIPQGDLEIIKNIFNNGVTLWHNTNTFLDYSQNNH